MDKIQKIREVIEKRYEYWKEKEFNSHSIESEIRMSECQHLLLMLDSMQEEPVHRTKADVDAAMQEVRAKAKVFTEAHKGKTAEQLLSEMQGREIIEEELVNAAKDVLKDKESARKFLLETGIMDANGNLAEPYRTEDSVSEDLEEVAKYYIPNENYHMIIESDEGGSGENVYDYKQLIDMFKAGAKWQKGQMMADAIDGKVIANGMGKPILHLWDKGKHLIDKKVKVILIKED